MGESIGTTRRRSRRTRVAAVALVVSGVVALAACDGYHDSVPRPDVAGPARYLDDVFPSVAKLSAQYYSTAADREGNPADLYADVYRPAGDTATDRPAVVLTHGGGYWSNHDKKNYATEMAVALAHRGYVGVVIDYRLLALANCGQIPEADQPDAQYGCRSAALAAVSDTAAAVRAVRARSAELGVDPHRVAISGDSAGGVISMILGTVPGLFDLDGTHPLWQFAFGDDPVDVNRAWPTESSRPDAWVGVSGTLPPDEAPMMPLMAAQLSVPPSPGYMFHGVEDESAMWESSKAAADMINEIPGGSVLYRTYDEGGHVYAGMWHDPVAGPDMLDQTTRFLYLMLDLENASQHVP